jgi:hypothetical protein
MLVEERNIACAQVKRMEVMDMTRDEFGDLLNGLPVGHTGTLPYNVYAEFFPPGEADQDARGRAFEFARDRGCEIENRPSHSGSHFY